MKTVGVYAGSFDPPTEGHVWMIRQGQKLFDTLIVLVSVNPAKKATFEISERVDLLREIFPEVSIKTLSSREFLVDEAKRLGATHLLRGIRNSTDFEYERVVRNINAERQPHITTVTLISPRDLCDVSSSTVMGLVGLSAWELTVTRYVPTNVLRRLLEKF